MGLIDLTESLGGFSELFNTCVVLRGAPGAEFTSMNVCYYSVSRAQRTCEVIREKNHPEIRGRQLNEEVRGGLSGRTAEGDLGEEVTPQAG